MKKIVYVECGQLFTVTARAMRLEIYANEDNLRHGEVSYRLIIENDRGVAQTELEGFFKPKKVGVFRLFKIKLNQYLM